MTETAKEVLEARYLWRVRGKRKPESVADLFWRVATAVADAEPTAAKKKYWSKQFREILVSGRFLPNSPTLMNAGKVGGQLAACFVLPVEDNLFSIYSTLRDAALIQQSGGGTGYSFSQLRPAGSRVGSTEGTAAGPLGFLRVFDISTQVVKQGGMRRGANMAVLDVGHPDIISFIESKRNLQAFTNFNISVGVSDRFMKCAMQAGDAYSKEREILDRIVDAAWSCGDPGLLFLDRINRDNPTPKLGKLLATNPCGEQPLLPYEACNLGSLNLARYWVPDRHEVNWGQVVEDARAATRFLDNVIEVNVHPIPECSEATSRTRKIGLGVMGFADLLLKMGIRYESDEAVKVGTKVMRIIQDSARSCSVDLAKERGAFPAWSGSRWQKAGLRKMRNATLTTVAPTGTLSAIAGVSSGIEPIFSAVLRRNVLE
ncbi:MAG: adenosylcobalamin-dependent ribonucleoside-diphosphate reductase, partial [Bdellovibrionota bacterium]